MASSILASRTIKISEAIFFIYTFGLKSKKNKINHSVINQDEISDVGILEIERKNIAIVKKIFKIKKGGYDVMDSFGSSIHTQSDTQSNNGEKKVEGSRIFSGFLSEFTLVIVIVVLFVVFSFLILGANFWFWLIVLVWFWFLGGYYGLLPAKFLFFTKWGIFYFAFILNIIFVFITVPDTNEEPDFKNSNNDYVSISCEAKNFEFKKNENVLTYIVGGYDTKYANRTKKEYSLEELKKYGFETKLLKADKKVYLLSQICNGDKLVSDLETSAVNPSMAGDKKGFTNLNFFDAFIKSQKIKVGEKYQIYGYYSYDGRTWFVNDKIEIEIKKEKQQKENSNEWVEKEKMAKIFGKLEKEAQTYHPASESFSNFCKEKKVIILLNELNKIQGINLFEKCKANKNSFVLSAKINQRNKKSAYCLSGNFVGTKLVVDFNNDLNNYSYDSNNDF